MEQKINIFAYAENVPEDINNLQTYVADSIDHIVADAIVATPRYAGFQAAKSGPAQVTLTITGTHCLHNAWLQALGDAVPYPDLLVPISMVVGDCRRALLPFTPNRFP